MLEEMVLKLVNSQGAWAVLFVVLLFYVLRTNEKREDRLIACIEKFDSRFEDLSKDMGEVKNDIKTLKGRAGA